MTPLQEAMLSATVANNGTLMKPYMVQKVTAPDLTTLATTTPTTLSHPVTPTLATNVTGDDDQVTQSPQGTAHLSAGTQVTGGIVIAAKTGTAQNGINNSGLDDAVFTCFAPANNPKIAVGVVVKGGGFGADAAAPIAVAIIRPTSAPRGRGEARDHGRRQDLDDWPPARGHGIRCGHRGALWTDNDAGRLLTCET